MAGREDICGACGAYITLADDGAWEDERGACGCGDGEHEPEGSGAADDPDGVAASRGQRPHYDNDGYEVWS